jgi:hypothetical protein
MDATRPYLLHRYVSFKAPINSNGVTAMYIRYNPGGTVTYQLPLIVSGSTTNDMELTVHVALDPDTLAVLNSERYQSRTDLYYKQLATRHYSFPATTVIQQGENTGLLPIDFRLGSLDLVDKWVLPITIVDGQNYHYISHPRKNYRKALLRVFPFNDYSGIYSGTALRTYLGDAVSGDAIVRNEVTTYVVDDNTIFFYAGTVDEDNPNRGEYKIYARFTDQIASQTIVNGEVISTTYKLEMWSDAASMSFVRKSDATYSIEETMDATRPYLLHRYVTISNIEYSFSDFTSVPSASIRYTVSGSLILERKINTQIPDQDQAIEW